AYFDGGPQGEAIFMDLAIQSEKTTPLGTLTASALTPSTSAALVPITFTASGATPFTAADVDSILRYNNGTAIITGLHSTTVLLGIWYIAPTNLKPAPTGTWSLTPQNDTFSGLD